MDTSTLFQDRLVVLCLWSTTHQVFWQVAPAFPIYRRLSPTLLTPEFYENHLGRIWKDNCQHPGSSPRESDLIVLGWGPTQQPHVSKAPQVILRSSQDGLPDWPSGPPRMDNGAERMPERGGFTYRLIFWITSQSVNINLESEGHRGHP